jgi:hypothetical protein
VPFIEPELIYIDMEKPITEPATSNSNDKENQGHGTVKTEKDCQEWLEGLMADDAKKEKPKAKFRFTLMVEVVKRQP